MLLINKTPFVAERYGLADENGIDLLLIILKATYRFDQKGSLSPVEEQQPIEMADLYCGEPGKSSIKYSSDFSFDKMGTDIAVTGYAYAPNRRARESLVSIQVGNLKKTIRVFGDRCWEGSLSSPSISKPEPFERIPLVYERSFGGIDDSNPDPGKHESEQRNPVGVGFRAKESRMPLEGMKLPNFEDPDRLIKNPDDRPNPVGLGFISPSWQPRLGFAGTYDEAWEKNRMPLLPADFNKKFFHSAHPDLTYNGFVKGDEKVRLAGMSAKGPVNFFLPNVHPACSVETRGSEELQKIDMKPDKLVFGSEDPELIIVWSGSLRIRKGFQDIRAIQCENQTGG
jgi:hypothetical protein